MWFKSYKKNGTRNRKQRYKCYNCGRIFQSTRVRNVQLATQLWNQYVNGYQTLQSLSNRYNLSYKTIRKYLDNHQIQQAEIIFDSSVIVMDTCYFRWGFGVMVFRDQKRQKNLFWKYVEHETLEEYKSGINHLLSNGLSIIGIVCDGKRGLFKAFGDIPVQMCQFHQIAIVIRYITRNPQLEAGIELKSLVHNLTRCTKAEFTEQLNNWHARWKEFLSEKTYNAEKDKWLYIHRRLRSAYRSLKTNLEYLFTYLEYPDQGIPNTTNSLEGKFSRLKTKLRIHSGLKEWRKKRFIDEVLSK